MILPILHSVLSGNQFASGGMLLMALGAIGDSLRKIPAAIWAHIVHQSTISIIIVDQIPPFEWFKEWYKEQKHAKKSRRIDVTPENNFVLAPGHHWFFYKGRPLWVQFSRTEDDKNVSGKRLEAFTVTTIGRNQKYFRNLMEDVYVAHCETEKQVPSLYVRGNGWEIIDGYKPRPLSTVILPQDVKDKFITDFTQFKASKDWYTSMGIPYHRGYMLHGPAGTGKTSLVTGLSSHFNNRVYLIDLNTQSDASLASAVKYCSEGSFIVLEDVDCCTKKRKLNKVDSSVQDNPDLGDDGVLVRASNVASLGVTLSGLLNVLDGIQSPSGVAFFMTTNHAESLDEALLRPGRVDMMEYIGPATTEQKTQLYFAFFPEDTKAAAAEFIEKHEAVTMASMQGELLKERNARLQGTKHTSATA